MSAQTTDRHLHAASNSLGLLDLLQQTPRLAQILLQNSKTAIALCGTSRAARALIQDHVTAVQVLEHNGYGLQYQIEAMKKLVNGRWPHLQKLDIKYRAKLQYEAIAILGQANWPCLTTLSLSRNSLEASAVQHLLHGNWPKLGSLDLSHNSLGAVGMEWLSKASWPCLQTLVLSDVQLNAEAVEELSKGDWRELRHVNLSYNRLDAASMAALLACHWTQLTSLDLSYNCLSQGALASLTQMNLPCLEKLVLAHNILSPNAMMQLAEGQWPQLRHLDLSLCCIQKPVLGKWQQLQWLSLSGNCLDLSEDGLSCLSEQLPSLRVLHMCDTDLGDGDINKLVCLQWPELEELYLGENMMIGPLGHVMLSHRLGTGIDAWWSCEGGAQSCTSLISVKLPVHYVGPWRKLRLIAVDSSV